MSGNINSGSGSQTYHNNLTLDAPTVTLTSGDLNFQGTVAGAGNSLDLNNSGVATLGGVVSGVNLLTARGSGSLLVNYKISARAVNDSESTRFDVVVGNPTVGTTGGGQTYSGSVTLNQNTTLADTGSGAMALTGPVTGNNNDLTVTTAGDINLASLSGGGAVDLHGANKTVGTVGAASITADGGSTTISGVQNISGAAVYDATTVRAQVNAGSAHFNSATFNVSGGGVSTSGGGQTYGGAVVLEAPTLLTDSGGDIIFSGTIDGPFALAVSTPGDEVFNGRVGGAQPLARLTTDGSIEGLGSPGGLGGSAIINVPGTTDNPSVRTTGRQTYWDNLVLGADVVLSGLGFVFPGGVTANGHTISLAFQFGGSIILTSLAEDNDRRLLATIMPQLRKGVVTKVETTGMAPILSGYLLRSCQVPLEEQQSEQTGIRYDPF